MKTMNSVAASVGLATFLFSTAFFAQPVGAAQVIVPDNGNGTAQMPILADYVALTPMQIVNGLGGDVINIDAILETPVVYAEQPGGSLGGTKSAGGGAGIFTWQMQGTGAFASYSRTFSFPVEPGPGATISFADPAFNTTAADFEVHAAPRVLNAPLQSFPTDMFRLFGIITNPGDNDPDFDLLRVFAGTDFGLPGPGHTTLLQNGPNWEVYSFFDMTYRIDFVANSTGPFAGRSGSTTLVVRLSLGDPIVPEPTSAALAGIGIVALPGLLRHRSRRQPK